MTATQHTPAPIDTDSLPLAIRRLEAALPGDPAYAPGGSPCAIKMESDSGRPWLLDPWGHAGAPSRATTAALAQMGYRTDARLPEREPVEPTLEAARAHLDHLSELGWTMGDASRASNVDRGYLLRIRKGSSATQRVIERILDIEPDFTPNLGTPTAAERAEDIEWLLDAGVDPAEAVRRCGYTNLKYARVAMRRAGRSDLLPRLAAQPRPAEESDLDDYDPYNDPTFKEIA